jgi:pimeloyl-ACP methyl ester carboxylesterase
MAGKKQQLKSVARDSSGLGGNGALRTTAPPPTVSPRWLLLAMGLTVAAAAVCAWATLCLLFWQGSWQLLYHPKAAVTRTPAGAGMDFDAVRFAATDAGRLRLQGWWIPAAANAKFARYTVIYLHRQNGNLSDAVDALAALHNLGVNVFAFDYRGYGQSEFAHPGEARWREDTAWALDYLTGTRHVDPRTVVLAGDGLGANLAIEVAAAHPEIAGAIAREPMTDAASAIFDDPRARLVPARLLVRDRWNLSAAAAALQVPSLWLLAGNGSAEPEAIQKVSTRKSVVWMGTGAAAEKNYAEALARWLDELSARRQPAAPVHSPS